MVKVQGKNTTNAPIKLRWQLYTTKHQLPMIITDTITSRCIILLLSTLTSNHGSYLVCNHARTNIHSDKDQKYLQPCMI